MIELDTGGGSGDSVGTALDESATCMLDSSAGLRDGDRCGDGELSPAEGIDTGEGSDSVGVGGDIGAGRCAPACDESADTGAGPGAVGVLVDTCGGDIRAGTAGMPVDTCGRDGGSGDSADIDTDPGDGSGESVGIAPGVLDSSAGASDGDEDGDPAPTAEGRTI